MANQPQTLTLPPPRTYTRTDLTALRAFVRLAAHLESINLRGTFDFPIGCFAHHLLPGVADLNAKQRRLA